MTFFQNPFPQDFQGNWVLGDRSHSLTFECPRNAGRSDELVTSWEDGPFDLSGNDTDGNSRDTLTIYYSIHYPFTRWAVLTVDVTSEAASSSSVYHHEISESLNASNDFSAWFTASINPNNKRVQIRSKKPGTEFHFYIVNGRAEEALRFNKRAGVAELPTYFDRHKVVHLFSTLALMESFPDRMNILIPLDPSNSGGASAVDDDVIDNAVDAFGNSKGFSSSTVQADYQLLKGRSGIFQFQSITVDSSDRITEIIEYPAGAKVGDFAKRTLYEYSGSNTNPDQKTELPYTLTSGDLVTP